MGARGPKPKRIIFEKWTPNLAYAIGLIATDGCLSRPEFGYLIDLTSKDKEQLRNYCKCLGIPVTIGKKLSGTGKKSFRVQFKNFLFYEFLLRLGITPAKSKTLGPLLIPDEYFFDFLRGAFDGDGCSYSYWDKRWKSSFMFYMGFASASKKYIDWIRQNVFKFLKIYGHVTKDGNGVTYQLKYAKNDSIKLCKKLYYSKKVVCLQRKRLKIIKTLDIMGLSGRTIPV